MKAIVQNDLIWGVGEDTDAAIADVRLSNDPETAEAVLADYYVVVELSNNRARAVVEDYVVEWP